MAIEFDPRKTINWTEDLEKIYHRQTQQLTDYQGQLRERDKQEEKADPGVALLETINKGMKFVGDVKSLSNAYEKGKKAKKDEAYKQFSTQMESWEYENGPLTREQWDALAGKYTLDGTKVVTEDVKFLEALESDAFLNAAGEKSEAYHYLKSLKPSEHLHLNEFLMRRHSQNLEGRWQELRAGWSDAEKQSFEALSEDEKRAFYKRFAGAGYERLKPSDGILSETVIKESNKWVKTKFASDSKKTQQKKLLSSREKDRNHLLTSLNAENQHAGSQTWSSQEQLIAASLPEDDPMGLGRTKHVRARALLISDAYGLAETGEIDATKALKLLTGEFPHEGGSIIKDINGEKVKYGTLETLMGKKEFAKFKRTLLQKVSEGQEYLINGAKKARENEGTLIAEKIIQNITANNYQGDQDAEIDAGLAALKKLGLGDDFSAVKTLTTLRGSDQSKEGIQSELHRWTKLINNGRVTDTKLKESIDSIESVQVKNMVLDAKKEQLLARAEQGYSTKHIKGYINYTKGQSFLNKTDFTENEILIETKLTNYQATRFNAYLADPTTRDQAAALAKRDTNQFWLDNGGKPTDGSENPIKGIFTYDNSGKKKGWNRFIEANNLNLNTQPREVERVLGDVSGTRYNTYIKNLSTDFKKVAETEGSNALAAFINTPQSINDVDETIAQLTTGYYSPELKIKAANLGLPAAIVMEAQTRALFNPEFLKANPEIAMKLAAAGLTEDSIGLSNINEHPEMKVYEILEGFSKYKNQLARGGYNSASPNFMNRVALIESRMNIKTSETLYPNGMNRIPLYNSSAIPDDQEMGSGVWNQQRQADAVQKAEEARRIAISDEALKALEDK